MLGWFVSLANIRKAIYAKAQAGGLIKEKIVETVPEKVPNCCNDKNVNIHYIRRYILLNSCLEGSPSSAGSEKRSRCMELPSV